ncbi:MAG: hypothetical protein M1840_004863 [Geoglossum simile]|nr:MAG: hypothetical protein M1840_004863 [Geoglossum simile]
MSKCLSSPLQPFSTLAFTYKASELELDVQRSVYNFGLELDIQRLVYNFGLGLDIQRLVQNDLKEEEFEEYVYKIDIDLAIVGKRDTKSKIIIVG